MNFKGLKIGFGITGSFCTINNVLKEMEKLIDEGSEVFPIISDSVNKLDTRFGMANDLKLKLETITGKKIISTIIESEPIGPKCLFDILVVAPCTGNTLSKISNAITDTTITMACKSHLRNQKPLIISISTNDGLGGNAKNIGILLNMKNIYFVPFYQDAHDIKPCSVIAKTELIIPTIIAALKGKQIQPILCEQLCPMCNLIER